METLITSNEIPPKIHALLTEILAAENIRIAVICDLICKRFETFLMSGLDAFQMLF